MPYLYDSMRRRGWPTGLRKGWSRPAGDRCRLWAVNLPPISTSSSAEARATGTPRRASGRPAGRVDLRRPGCGSHLPSPQPLAKNRVAVARRARRSSGGVRPPATFEKWSSLVVPADRNRDPLLQRLQVHVGDHLVDRGVDASPRWITVKGALAYIMSSRPWTISSPSMPSSAAPSSCCSGRRR